MVVKGRLTVLFEAPFWIGLYERTCDGKYEVCKITFGKEPKDYEVYAFLLASWNRLEFSPPIAADSFEERRISPKRMQREVGAQLENRGIGTKAQQALKLQREERRSVRKTLSKEQRETEKERQFSLRQAKKKEKHRGR